MVLNHRNLSMTDQLMFLKNLPTAAKCRMAVIMPHLAVKVNTTVTTQVMVNNTMVISPMANQKLVMGCKNLAMIITGLLMALGLMEEVREDMAVIRVCTDMDRLMEVVMEDKEAMVVFRDLMAVVQDMEADPLVVLKDPMDLKQAMVEVKGPMAEAKDLMEPLSLHKAITIKMILTADLTVEAKGLTEELQGLMVAARDLMAAVLGTMEVLKVLMVLQTTRIGRRMVVDRTMISLLMESRTNRSHLMKMMTLIQVIILRFHAKKFRELMIT